MTVTGDTDPERIIGLLGDVTRRDPRVSGDPAVLLLRFGDASADFQVRFWTDDTDWMRVRSDIAVALQRALRETRNQGDA